jgi:NitT/TauT family transport system ATP-binding protein
MALRHASDDATQGGAEIAVTAAGVGKTFAAKGDDVVALTGVDLEVAGGEFVSLIGPSGCGKSTLMRLIADLDEASTGTIEGARRSGLRHRLPAGRAAAVAHRRR